MSNNKKIYKAVGLLSGGLDSMLAVKTILNQGINVIGIYFAMPWDHAKNIRTEKAARTLGIELKIIQLDNEYLKMISNPEFGYGNAYNPCIDCHSYMIMLAGKYMNEIGASFIFTGEVLGQRPMSQLKQALNSVFNLSGLNGRLLRPLSAKLLDPTIPENEGIVDREKLHAISGRSRKEQIQLAKEWGITDYPNPAGGCLLTDKNFGRRIKDLIDHGCKNYSETIILKWGRHYRLNENFKVVLGKNETENNLLKEHADGNNYIMELDDKRGPTLILIGDNPTSDILAAAGGLIQNFTKSKNSSPRVIEYWQAQSPSEVNSINAKILSQDEIESMAI